MSKERDAEVVALQIGRPLRAGCTVARRCGLGLPIVTEVQPVLETGEPFPTRYWLGCPLATRRISRIEAQGGVREISELAAREPAFAEALERTHARYAKERDEHVPEDARYRPTGGVGGARRGVKCLHAHFADWAAGNENPVGEQILKRVMPLNCVEPCVVVDDEGCRKNEAWYEPDLGSA